MKKTVLACMTLGLAVIVAAGPALAASKRPEVSRSGKTRSQLAAEQNDLFESLRQTRPAHSRSHRVELTQAELSELANPSVDVTGRFRVGFSRAVSEQVKSRDGEVVFDAFGPDRVRLHLQGVKGIVFVWNERGEAREYLQDGWTHSFAPPVRVRTSESVRVTEMGVIANPQAGSGFCDYNAECVVNASCSSMPSAISAARDGVGHMLFRSGGGWYICSGGLVADSDPNSDIPYFLTANHCLSRNKDAGSLEVYFDYTIGCNDTCGPYDRPDTPRTLGSSVVATNRTSDFTLLELSEPAPAGTTFLGWNSDPVAYNNGQSLYRISHPGGAPQAFSEHRVDTSKGTCSSWPRGDWIYSRDITGATEGGSSGSPVLNANGEVVGQLSGGCGTNVYDSCDAQNNATVDGAFAAYYGQVAGILGSGGGEDPPPGGCTDNDGDGHCAEDGDCNDNDSNVYPGHNDTKGRWGRDGVDNDCNGVIDG